MATEPTKDLEEPEQLFAMYPVLRATLVDNLSKWILGTGASHHVTGSRNSIVWDYRRFAPGEKQVRIADDTIVDAAGEGTALIKIDNPRSTIVLQHAPHVSVCGNNHC